MGVEPACCHAMRCWAVRPKPRGLPRGLLESQAAANRQRAAVPESIYREVLYKAFTPDSREAFQRVVVGLNTGDYAAIIHGAARPSAKFG